MRRPSRRSTLALGAALIGAAGLSRLAQSAVNPTLAELAKANHLIFGASGGSELISDQDYRAIFLKQTAIFTPDVALKIGSLQPEQGRFNFGPADTLVDAARDHGLMVHGHTLFWNDWLPGWLKTLSQGEVARAFETYLDTVVPHFAGRLQSWDVVNEPFYPGHDKPGTFRTGVWYDALGSDYIFRAFRRTAELDPHAKLVLNEAWTERTDSLGLATRRSLLALIDRMQDKGVRLDAIGLQAHLTPQIAYDDNSFADFLHEIAQRGLEIYITEFDVFDGSFADDVAARDLAVAARTSAFLDAALAVPAVKMIITWGLTDRYTWWRDPSVMAAYGQTRLPRPLPYDDMLEQKPMWYAMADSFRRRGVLRSRG